MKRLIFGVLGLMAIPLMAFSETMYVQVEKARLLEKPSSFARCKKNLTYQMPVEVIALQGAFYEVTYQQKHGYLSQRSLTGTKPVYSAKLSKEYVSSEEVALATKGFNAQVEAEYRQKNPALAYKALDRLEVATTYSDEANHFTEFRKTGHLGENAKGGSQ
jgi:hypothetical protein